MSELLFPESVVLSPDVEKSAFDRMRELSRLRTYFFVLSILMMMTSGMLRQYRWVSVLLAAGSGLVCAGLWLAETRPRLAALAIGPLVETRAEARLRRWRSACLLVSFVSLPVALFAGHAYRDALMALPISSLVAWVVLAFQGRRRR